MLTLKRKVAKSILLLLSRFLFKSIKMGKIGFYAIDQNREITVKMHNLLSEHTKQRSLALVRACVAPVCDFKSKVEVVTHDKLLRLVGEM